MPERGEASTSALREGKLLHMRLTLFSSTWEKGATEVSAAEKVSAGACLRHQIIQLLEICEKENQRMLLS